MTPKWWFASSRTYFARWTHSLPTERGREFGADADDCVSSNSGARLVTTARLLPPRSGSERPRSVRLLEIERSVSCSRIHVPPTLLGGGRLSRCMRRNYANQIHPRPITVFVCQALAKAIGDEEALSLLKPDVESIELLSGPAV